MGSGRIWEHKILYFPLGNQHASVHPTAQGLVKPHLGFGWDAEVGVGAQWPPCFGWEGSRGPWSSTCLVQLTGCRALRTCGVLEQIFFVPVEGSPDGPIPHSCILGALPAVAPAAGASPALSLPQADLQRSIFRAGAVSRSSCHRGCPESPFVDKALQLLPPLAPPLRPGAGGRVKAASVRGRGSGDRSQPARPSRPGLLGTTPCSPAVLRDRSRPFFTRPGILGLNPHSAGALVDCPQPCPALPGAAGRFSSRERAAHCSCCCCPAPGSAQAWAGAGAGAGVPCPGEPLPEPPLPADSELLSPGAGGQLQGGDPWLGACLADPVFESIPSLPQRA